MAEIPSQNFQDQTTNELFEADSLTVEDIEDVELNSEQSIIPEIVGTGLTIGFAIGMGVLETSLVETSQFGLHFSRHYTSNEIYQAVINAILMIAPRGFHKLSHKVYNWISGNKTRVGLTDIISSIPLSLTTQNTAAWVAGKIKGWTWSMEYLGKADKVCIIKTDIGKALFSNSGLGISYAHLLGYGIGFSTLSLSLLNRLKPRKKLDKVDKFGSRIYNFISEFSSKSPLHNYVATTLITGSLGLLTTLFTGNRYFVLGPLAYSVVDIAARGEQFRNYIFEKYGEQLVNYSERATITINNLLDKLPI